MNETYINQEILVAIDFTGAEGAGWIIGALTWEAWIDLTTVDCAGVEEYGLDFNLPVEPGVYLWTGEIKYEGDPNGDGAVYTGKYEEIRPDLLGVYLTRMKEAKAQYERTLQS